MRDATTTDEPVHAALDTARDPTPDDSWTEHWLVAAVLAVGMFCIGVSEADRAADAAADAPHRATHATSDPARWCPRDQ
jgi:hypothetical protein